MMDCYYDRRAGYRRPCSRRAPALYWTAPGYEVGTSETLLTCSQAARHLGICCQDIELMVKRRLIPVHTTLSGHQFVRASEIVRCQTIFNL